MCDDCATVENVDDIIVDDAPVCYVQVSQTNNSHVSWMM